MGPHEPATETVAESPSQVAVLPNGYLEDFISGSPVRATPEELEGTQPFARRLVDVYSYDKSQIRTRPQYRVRESPSGRDRYPVDIVVFNDERHDDDNVYMLIETKQKSRKDGRKQLDIYLNMVPSAQIGVWYNGETHLFLRRIAGTTSAWAWEEIPDLPRKGQTLDDIGKQTRSSLTTPVTLIPEFKDIRNFLAANATGITRDAEIAAQIIDILFCKIYDEKHKGPDELMDFRAGIREPASDVRERIEGLFEKVKDRRSDGYEDLFNRSDSIRLDDKSLTYVVGLLQQFELSQAGRDVVGEAFEAFIGPALRGDEGQFFTPRNLVRLAVELVNPRSNEYVIDPACGSGGFLTVALEHVWQAIDDDLRAKRFPDADILDRRRAVAMEYFAGLEKDDFLSKITKAHMAVIGDGRAGIFCENSLAKPTQWSRNCQLKIDLGKYDVVITNPPFGAKIPVSGTEILSQYSLGHKWANKKDGPTQTDKLHLSQPPQILFIERCLQLLAPGGRMAVVLPEGIAGNNNDSHVRAFIREHAVILAIIDCPLETFLPSTPTKVVLMILQKKRNQTHQQGPIFMAIAESCGHDRRGVPTLRDDGTPDDDFPEIALEFSKFLEQENVRL